MLGRALHTGAEGNGEWQSLRDNKFAPYIDATAASTTSGGDGWYSRDIVRTLKLMMDPSPAKRPSAAQVADYCKKVLAINARHAVSPSHANSSAVFEHKCGFESEVQALREENARLKARLQALE